MSVNTVPTSNMPVRGIERTVLSTTNTGNSGWIDLSGLLNWTAFFSGMESGSTLKVEVANGAAGPTNGVVLVAALAPDANGVAQYTCSAAPFHWVRFTKTQGTTPTATTGTLHALFA